MITSSTPRRRICLLTDTVERADALSTLLRDDGEIVALAIAGADAPPPDCDAIIVAADMRDVATIAWLRERMAHLHDVPCRLFVLSRTDHSRVVQARALGATDVLFRPVTAESLRARLPRTHAAARAVDGCAAALRAVFDQMAAPHRRLDLEQADAATDTIIASVAANGLGAWLDEVRRHHEGTFQHCLLVAGVAVDFGLSLGLAGRDLHNLGLAATLHDIGKIGISLDILDKAGRLDADERRIIEQHPSIGFDCIRGTRDLPADVAEAVLHHHEYLDGSGYPDRLTAPQIPDLTRIITIADVFAALIERRRYKPPVARERAYAMLGEMAGKLEQPLVVAFRATATRR